MNKYKINDTVVAILLIASYFVGWQTMLLVGVLLFAFCDIGENLKNLAIRLLSFCVGIKLFDLAWSIIYKLVNLIPSILNKLIAIFNNYLDKPIEIDKFKQYILDPITGLMSIADDVVGLLIIVATFYFIASLLLGKNKKTPIIDKYISTYIEKALSFVSQFNVNNVQSNVNNQPNMNNIQQNNIQQSNVQMPNINNQQNNQM